MSKVTFHFQLLFSHPFRLSFSRFKFIRFPRSHGIRTYRSISTTVDPNAWFYVYVCRGSITLHYTSTIDGRGLHQRGFIGSLATLRSMSHTHTHIDLTRWTPSPSLTVQRPFLRYVYRSRQLERGLPRLKVESSLRSSRESFLLISNNRVHRLLTGSGIIRVRAGGRFLE